MKSHIWKQTKCRKISTVVIFYYVFIIFIYKQHNQLTGMMRQQLPSLGHSASVSILSQSRAKKSPTHSPLHFFKTKGNGVVFFMCVMSDGYKVVLCSI